MDDLTLACTAAREAAQIVHGWANRLESADFKGIGNPVTDADREAEAAILSLIEEHRPNDGVLGEEGASKEGTSGRRWVIDPLDGTVNFLHGFPQVAVSIAVEDADGAIVGVIRDVFRDEEFVAQRGLGATLNGAPIQVSGRNQLGDGLIATGFSYDRQERWQEYGRVLGEMLRQVRGVRRGGSAALDLAWVACGRLDGYWELRLGPWDVAAGYLIVAEAGGRVTALDGSPATHEECVAANAAIHPALLEAVATAVIG
jgi:myo-inositol-1(or 4)-monophosphatase